MATKQRQARRPKRLDRVQAYLRELAQRICLADWTITVESTPLSDRELCFAAVSCIDGHRAMVELAPCFWLESPESQRRILVHELGHLPAARFTDVGTQLRATLPPETATAIILGYDAAEEHIVEWIARVVAPTLPLPPPFTARGKA